MNQFDFVVLDDGAVTVITYTGEQSVVTVLSFEEFVNFSKETTATLETATIAYRLHNQFV